MVTRSPDGELSDAAPQPKPQRGRIVALGWGLACAVCAGGVSLFVFDRLNEPVVHNSELQNRLPTAAFVIAGVGAVAGLITGLMVGLHHDGHKPSVALGLLGAITGVVGGSLTIPTVILFRAWLSPLASTSLLWAIVGFVVGVVSWKLSPWLAATSEAVETTEEQRAKSDPFRRLIARLCLLVLLALGSFLLLALLTISTTRY